MLNLGGIFGAIGRMLPGYIQGREMAIQSNWNDLNQYNQTLAGQLQNAFNEVTMPLAYNRYYDAATISRNQARWANADWWTRAIGLPGEFATAAIKAGWAPELANQQAQTAVNNLQQQQSLSGWMQQPQGLTGDIIEQYRQEASRNRQQALGGGKQVQPTTVQNQ